MPMQRSRPAEPRTAVPLLAGLVAVLPLVRGARAQDVALELVVSGLDFPVQALPRPGDGRLLVLEQHAGLVRVVEDGALLPTPFLDVSADVNGWFEGGLLSMAFPPDHAVSGRFHVSLMVTGDELVVREYRVPPGSDVADPTPVAELLRLPQSSPIHNGGHLAHGPDGMLYVALGDGGPGGDPNQRGQDTANLYGGIARLDPDLPPAFVPPDNPFVGVPGAAEALWAYGLRSPWRLDFDPVDGDLWITDVGQTTREEVDWLAAGSPGGTNFGWRCREGTSCFDAACCDDPGLVDPIFEYGHDSGRCAVIGGVVYRGDLLPALQGAFVASDFCSTELFVLRQENGALVESTILPSPTLGGLDVIQRLASVARDGAGEVLLVDAGPGPGTGEIFRLVPRPGVQRYCEAGVNSLGLRARLDTLGSTSLGAADLTLRLTRAAPQQSALFFYGPAPTKVPFRDGFRCVGVSAPVFLQRLAPVVSLDGTGSGSLAPDPAAAPMGSGPGAVLAGSTWFFQSWYRDPASNGSGENLSDALALTFAP